jgi:hypothetical protein
VQAAIGRTLGGDAFALYSNGMARRRTPDEIKVQSPRGRTWTVTVLNVDDDDDLMPWLDMSPDERVALIGECVLDGLRTKGRRGVRRLRRVHRVTQRPSRSPR